MMKLSNLSMIAMRVQWFLSSSKDENRPYNRGDFCIICKDLNNKGSVVNNY